MDIAFWWSFSDEGSASAGLFEPHKQIQEPTLHNVNVAIDYKSKCLGKVMPKSWSLTVSVASKSKSKSSISDFLPKWFQYVTQVNGGVI